MREEELTRIYYWTTDFEPIAKGLAELLGIDPTHITMSDAYLGSPVTILLGSDYTPPGS